MPDVSGALKAFIKTYADMKPDEERMALLDLREQVMELEEENKSFREANDELKRELKLRKELEFIDGGYYVLDDEGAKTGPICPECYTGKGFVYLLVQSRNGAKCVTCGKDYGGVEGGVEGAKARIC